MADALEREEMMQEMATSFWIRYNYLRFVDWLLNTLARLLARCGLLVYPGIEHGSCNMCGTRYKAWFPRMVVMFEDTGEYTRYFRRTVKRCRKCGCPLVDTKIWKNMTVFEPKKRSGKMNEKEQALQRKTAQMEKDLAKSPARLYHIEKRSGGVDKVLADGLSPTDRDFAFYLNTKLVYVIPRDNCAAIRVEDEK